MGFKNIKELVIKKLEKKGYVEQEVIDAIDLTIKDVLGLIETFKETEQMKKLKARITG